MTVLGQMAAGEHGPWHPTARAMILKAIRAAHGDRDKAAEDLKISRRTLERALTTLVLRPLLEDLHQYRGGRPIETDGCPECAKLTAAEQTKARRR